MHGWSVAAGLAFSVVCHGAVWPKFAGTSGNSAAVNATAPQHLSDAVVVASPHVGVQRKAGVVVNYGHVFAYAPGATGMIHCLDAVTLTAVWSAAVMIDDSLAGDWGSWATLSVANSSVVYAAYGFLGCWNLDGSLRWQTTMARETVNSSPVISGSRVIVGCFSYMNVDGGVAGYDLYTGSQLWYTVAIPNNTFSSCTPAVDEAAGVGYAACSNQVWRFNLATGYIEWQESVPGAWLQLNNVSLAGDTLLAVNYDFAFAETNLFAFDTVAGTLKWAAVCGMSDMPPAVHGATVIHGCGDNLVAPAVTAFDLETGAQLWQRAGVGNIFAMPAVAAGVVYTAVGVYDGWTLAFMSNLTALSVGDGSVISATGDARGGQSPAIGDDVVYTANDGVVYAYRWNALPLLLKKFTAQIRPAQGGKDQFKLAGNVENPPANVGEPVYIRVGEYVLQGDTLGTGVNATRDYTVVMATKLNKKKGLMIQALGKYGSLAGMLPYLPHDGTTQVALPLVMLTDQGQYIRAEMDLVLTTKKGKVKAKPAKVK